METQFRLATDADAEEIMALYRSQLDLEGVTWDEEYPSWDFIVEDLQNKSLFLLEEDGRIVAAASAAEDPDMMDHPVWNAALGPAIMLERVAVRRDCQGRGLAKRVMRGAMQEMRRRGYRAARYLVGPGNLRARAAYRGLNFHLAGEAEAYGERSARSANRRLGPRDAPRICGNESFMVY